MGPVVCQHRGRGASAVVGGLDKALAQLPLDLPASQLSMQSSRPQGSARMTADPKRGVVAPDGSLFPSAVSVNPQITIMAFAKVIARNVLKA